MIRALAAAEIVAFTRDGAAHAVAGGAGMRQPVGRAPTRGLHHGEPET
jgi:hypothetical protein